MTQEHHKHYNEFLNGVVAQAHQEKLTTNPDREAVGYKHLKESDEFYELTVQGRKALPQNLTHWFGLSKYAPKVRKTFDLTGGGTLKEQIIKTRIADLEVYNPNTAFDYRISLSLETAVVLEPQHLVAAKEHDRDRQKDRLSYRHFYNQIDLTQVSYPGAMEKEHELEVEIAELMIERELDKLNNRQESSYEELITSFLNNVRLLCRAGT